MVDSTGADRQRGVGPIFANVGSADEKEEAVPV